MVQPHLTGHIQSLTKSCLGLSLNQIQRMHRVYLESSIPKVGTPKHTILWRTITVSLGIIINVANGGVLNAVHGLVVDTGLLALALALALARGGPLGFSRCLGHPFSLSFQPLDFGLVNKL